MQLLSKTDAPELPVAVSGATGGVGSIAVGLLSKLGIDVTAITGKVEFKPISKRSWSKKYNLKG